MRRIPLPLPWPGVTATVGAFGIPGTESRLDAAMKRVHRSRCARALAVELLDAQRVRVDAIAKGPVGEPIWPEGFVGSLAHTDHYAAAVVASQGKVLALGIDIESALPLPQEAAELTLGEDERAWAEAQGQESAAGRLILGAKQCVHKAIQPLTRAWLDSEEIQINCDLLSETFRVQPRSAAAQRAFAGRRAEGCIRRIDQHWVPVLAIF